MPLRTTAALAALALVASACGGDDTDADIDVSTTTPAEQSATTDALREATADAEPIEDDAVVASAPKQDAPGRASAGKPGASDAAEPTRAPDARPTGGKPSAGSRAEGGRATGGAQAHDGTLEDGDETLDSGEYADGYTVTVAEGQTITVDLTSSDFDTYLILRSPSGEQFDNDDLGDDTAHSQIVQQAGEGGEWQIVVTSYESDETGDYALSIRTR